MGTFAIIAIISVSLFTGGTVLKPTNPDLGYTMQAVGVGTLIGGSVGTAGAITGGVIGAAVAPFYTPKIPNW